jgi:DNA-binding response OmpR family regulator
MAEKVLILDDEADIVAGVEDTLVREGYEVITASNGKDGLKKAAECGPDLIVLDVMMPEMNGYEVLAALRKKDIRTAVIMLTGRDAEDDKIRGLDTGADDYVTKPFRMQELAARIRAVRRRHAEKEGKIHSFAFGNVEVDFERQTVVKDGETTVMSTCESELLRLLVARRGDTISRETILTEVWGYDVAPDTRTVDNHVAQLRQKIEDDSRQPKHILTAHGKGYKFAP